MNELTLTNIEEKVKVQAPVIDFDVESIKTALRTVMSNYDTVAFGDDSSLQDQYKSMKADRVELNKAVKALGAMDSSIRKKVLAPFEEYKNKSGELKSIIEEILLPIDDKVKEIEQYWKEEKLNNIKNIYEQLATDIDEDYKAILFNMIFSESWTNQTSSLKKVTAEMEEMIGKYTSGLSLIKTLNSDFEKEGIEILKDTLDITQAVSKMQELNSIKERALAAEKARLEEQKQKEIDEAKAKADAEAKARLDKELAAEKEKIKADAEAKAKIDAENLDAKRKQFEEDMKNQTEEFAREKNAFFANQAMNNNQAATMSAAASTTAADGKTLIEVPTVAVKAITRFLENMKIAYTVK